MLPRLTVWRTPILVRQAMRGSPALLFGFARTLVAGSGGPSGRPSGCVVRIALRCNPHLVEVSRVAQIDDRLTADQLSGRFVRKTCVLDVCRQRSGTIDHLKFAMGSCHRVRERNDVIYDTRRSLARMRGVFMFGIILLRTWWHVGQVALLVPSPLPRLLPAAFGTSSFETCTTSETL